MRIRPSTHGFYFKNYLFASVLALILLAAGIYIALSGGEALLAAGLVAASLLIVLVGVAHSIVNTNSTYIEIADERVIYDSGIFSHRMVSAPVSRITDTSIRRSFYDRILGTGDLLVNTSGTSSIEIFANDFNYSEISILHDKLTKLINSTQYKRSEAGEAGREK